MFFLFQALLVTILPVLLLRIYSNIRRLDSKSIPGPFLASVTDIWRSYLMRQSQYSEKVRDLHERYGKVVRLGPNYVSVSDANAVSVVYATNPSWVKAHSYDPLIGMSGGQEIQSVVTLSDAKITAVKKGIANAFTTNTLLDYENYIDQTADEFLRKISGLGTLDLGQWFQYYTMDLLARIAFSESMGFLNAGSDIGNTMGTITARFDHWGRWAAIPGIERLIYRNPITKWVEGGSSPLAALAVGKFRARKATTSPPPQRDLLQKYIEASEKHPEWISSDNIIGLLMSTLAAGADTTAVTMASFFYLTLKNRLVWDKLLSEFQGALRRGELSNTPRWSEVHKLTYLDLVIKETMRMMPIADFGIDRIVPEGGVTIDNRFIPAGTTVGVNQMAIHYDRDVYGKDVDEFRPERWMDVDDAQRRKMERGFVGFSAGKRICLGMHIAHLEMKKTIPDLMIHFDMQLEDPNMKYTTRAGSVRYPPPIWVKVTPRELK